MDLPRINNLARIETMTLRGRSSLTNAGFNRDQLRQGVQQAESITQLVARAIGTRAQNFANGLIGATELFVYQTPNKKPKGFDALKQFVSASECELIFTFDVPPELKNYEAFRVTHKSGEKIPDDVLKRCHSWAHGRNFLHSFFNCSFF